MKKFYLCNVQVRKYRRQRHNIKSAMIALDIKIKDWIDRIALSDKYAETRRCRAEFSEIMGGLKFLYQSDILTADEYRRIIKNLVGVDSEEELETEDQEVRSAC